MSRVRRSACTRAVARGDVQPDREQHCARRTANHGYFAALYSCAMKIVRLLLVLLWCATLPLTGLAASGLAGDCPMQQAMSMSEDGAMPSMQDCESMRSSVAGKSGKSGEAANVFCKVMVQCQFGSLYHPMPAADVARPASPGRPLVFHYAKSLTVREPGGLWRPPRTA